MHRVTRSDQSLADIVELAETIAEDQPAAAIRFLDQIEHDLRDLLEHPDIGTPWITRRPKLQGIRRWPVHGFTAVGIFYRPTRGGIEVIRVIHGARHLGTGDLETGR